MMKKLKIGGSKVLEAGKLNVIVTGKLYDKDGNLKQMFVKHNLITNSGYEFLACGCCAILGLSDFSLMYSSCSLH